jgi:glucose-1-phosphate thymidylyltransferase
MKGIILAGGKGSRLNPITKGVNKHLIPIFDKPMIFYPISTLMLAGIREILLIVNQEDLKQYTALFGNGSSLGIKIEFLIQEKPEGLPQAFVLAEKFIGKDSVTLILGDNVFYGQGVYDMIQKSIKSNQGATYFSIKVNNPENFGIINIDNKIVSFEEKPKKPKSNLASVGLYIFNNSVIEHSKSLKKSLRGEYEMKDLFDIYSKNNELDIKVFGRGVTWLDTGSIENLNKASNFIKLVQQNNSFLVACLEEIAFNNNWINKLQVRKIAEKLGENFYKDYLFSILDEK